MALQYMAGGMDRKTAVEKATQEVFGKAYKVIDKTSSEIMALKIIHLDIKDAENVLENLKSEFQLLKELRHENIT